MLDKKRLFPKTVKGTPPKGKKKADKPKQGRGKKHAESGGKKVLEYCDG